MTNEEYMRYCISLAEKSVDADEWPFACIIVKNGEIIAESINGVHKHMDIASHAEILAMKEAQKVLNTHDLSDCEIFSNCEPCAMCSLIIRALKFKKVVFSLPSPYMGGYTKWTILQDTKLEELKSDFNNPPEVIAGLLQEEAVKTFKRIRWGEMLEPIV